MLLNETGVTRRRKPLIYVSGCLTGWKSSESEWVLKMAK